MNHRKTLTTITIQIPQDTLSKAQQITGGTIPETISQGFQKIISSWTYQNLLLWEGRENLTFDIHASREDRPLL